MVGILPSAEILLAGAVAGKSSFNRFVSGEDIVYSQVS